MSDDDFNSFIDSFRELVAEIHALHLKNAADLGYIKAQVSEIIGIIKARDLNG